MSLAAALHSALAGLQTGCNSSSAHTMSAHHVCSLGFSRAAPLWCDGEAGSLPLTEEQTAGPQAIPGEIFTLREPLQCVFGSDVLARLGRFSLPCVRPTECSLYHH